MSAAEARVVLELATQRALAEAARCRHPEGLCPFCQAHAETILNAAEAYAAAVAAQALDDFRKGAPARAAAERSLAERLAAANPQVVRLGKSAGHP